MSDNGSTRKDIRVPNKLLAEIAEYQKDNDIRHWTQALLLLARKGLDAEKKREWVTLLLFCVFSSKF